LTGQRDPPTQQRQREKQTDIERDRERQTEIDRPREEREKERQTYRQRETQTHRQRESIKGHFADSSPSADYKSCGLR